MKIWEYCQGTQVPRTEIISQQEAHYHLSDGSVVVDYRKNHRVRANNRFAYPHLCMPKVWCIIGRYGECGFIDEADIPLIVEGNWNVDPDGYFRKSNRESRAIPLHRAVSGIKNADHIFGRTRDNRRSQLRESTDAQNIQNQKKQDRVRYKGVKKDTTCKNKWIARVAANKIRYTVGRFDTPEEASVAREEFAKKLHGEFYRPPNGLPCF